MRQAPTVVPPDGTRLRRAERAENFPVALRVLPRRLRDRLRAVYDVVRVIDDLGDEGPADPAARTEALQTLRTDLPSVWATDGMPTVAVLRRLRPVARQTHLPREAFEHLVAANLADQRVTRYPDRDALMGYCALSANPIGRLVLAVFEVQATPDLLRAADRVCSALQLLEHWQDIGEDRRRGRVYLPGDAMAAAGVAEDDLDHPVAGPALRRLVLDETERALALLRSGQDVVGRLHGWARIAVAGYVAGGLAACDALRRCDGEVLARTPHARRADVARHLVITLARRGRGGR